MLVQINTEVGAQSTDFKSRYFNFMACLHAVATAAAGSTPVVNPVITSTGLKNTSYNCITVLSNSEAGGWTTGVSNNITAATTYNSSFASAYTVDLYNYTGKTTYPYYRLGFKNNEYTFGSGSFDSYPWMNSWCGHTSNDPSTVVQTSDTSWNNATWSSGFNPSATATYNKTSYPYLQIPYIAAPAQTMYIACTATYMIIATPYDIWYFGQRTVSPWELTRTDNPPWVSFGLSGSQANYPNPAIPNYPYASFYQAWTSVASPEGSYTATPVKVGNNWQHSAYSSGGWCALTGQQYGGSMVNYSANGNSNYILPATHPLATVIAMNLSYTTFYDQVMTDPVTGQTVPPAYPMIFRSIRQVSTGNSVTGTQSANGVIQGILRGPTTSNVGYAAQMTSSEYAIGGSTYIPIRTFNGDVNNQDCWFIRKA